MDKNQNTMMFAFLILGIGALAVVVLTRKPEPVVVKESSGGGGGIGGALNGLSNLAAAVLNKMDF